jgi:hypothetical protein
MKGAIGICIKVKEAPHNNKEVKMSHFILNAIAKTMRSPNNGTKRLERKK